MFKDYASKCTLSTYGVTCSEYEELSNAAKSGGVEMSYTEEFGEGRITLAKSAVDDVAIADALKRLLMTIGDKVYSDEDITLAKYAVRLLGDSGLMLAVAESLTGGLLSSAICDIEGASTVFYEGLVTYNNASKVRRLHVPSKVIEEQTAVSADVCTAMLKGALANKEINIALATTGYASGMNRLNGKVFIGIGDKQNMQILEETFDGDRNSVRKQAVNKALFMLCKWLKK